MTEDRSNDAIVPYGYVRDYELEHTVLGYTLRSLDRVWVVVTLQEWPEDGHPELTYWCGGHWHFDMADEVLAYRNVHDAKKVAEDLTERVGQPVLPICCGDLTRDEGAYMASYFSDYRNEFGPVKRRTSLETLAILARQGRHTNTLRKFTGPFCLEVSPERTSRCWLDRGHEHAHEGPHPMNRPGWTVSWAHRARGTAANTA